MKKSEVDKAVKEFVDHLLSLDQDGIIVIKKDEEEYI